MIGQQTSDTHMTSTHMIGQQTNKRHTHEVNTYDWTTNKRHTHEVDTYDWTTNNTLIRSTHITTGRQTNDTHTRLTHMIGQQTKHIHTHPHAHTHTHTHSLSYALFQPHSLHTQVQSQQVQFSADSASPLRIPNPVTHIAGLSITEFRDIAL